MKKHDLARMIDHTLLAPNASSEDIRRLCREAAENDFASVCIQPCYVPLAAECLKGSRAKVCTVIGFPLGVNCTEIKAAEAAKAVADGADEVDMVLNRSLVADGRWAEVQKDIETVVAAAKGRLVKVILEATELQPDVLAEAARTAVAAGADFVKTSTGFVGGGACVEDICIMKEAVGDRARIKASGGIHSYDEAMAMIAAGATRIGASAGLAILAGAED
ncbi:MAG: deoxyribose-phosphate aldolase [Clostridiales bacterium]|nr:deoxyribose-phosphate aldolase [Clostridiales bacterium]MDD7432039.1 deoxyribose-phosphate aldolase [Clostridiales bacterium]MDY3061024.1 deoxyribose-phosphate aldolase [Eubacteriales bacterium]